MTQQKNEYQKAVEAAEKRKNQLTLKQKQEIKEMYVRIAYDLSKQLGKTNPKAVTFAWLDGYKAALLDDIAALNKELNRRIRQNMRAAAQAAVKPQQLFFDSAIEKYGVSMGGFGDVFSTIPEDVIKKLLSGKLYQDKRTLSQRIWRQGVQTGKDIEYIIAQGIAAKKSAYELAKDLEDYVNPEAAKDWDWHEVYPNCHRKIDYNAQRLARTAVGHAYQMAQKESCKRNPYVDGIRWLASEHGRTCPLCRERSGQNNYGLGQGVYPVDEVPLDHPNGRCSTLPVVTKSLEEIGAEIGGWLQGGTNTMLDEWYAQYKKEKGV